MGNPLAIIGDEDVSCSNNLRRAVAGRWAQINWNVCLLQKVFFHNLAREELHLLPQKQYSTVQVLLL